MKERGISQTSISKYRFCPHACKLYLARKPPMFFDPDVMSVGQYVHEAVDRYYKNNFLQEGDANDILVKTYENLKKVWDMSLPPEQFKKAYDCLIHHANWEERNMNGGIGTQPLTEVKINGNGYYGIIDYIDLNNMKVIDYKTQKYAVLSHEFRMQAHVYKKLFESQFKKELTHFYFYFLYPDDWRTVKYDSPKQKEVGVEVEALRDKIKDGDFPKQPRTKSACDSCEYKFYCKVTG